MQTDQHRQHRPFFVIGSSRSGTTMLRLMLNSHSRLSIPGETWFLSELMDKLPLSGGLTDAQKNIAVDTILNHWRWKEWGIDDQSLVQAVGRLENPSLADLIDATYSLTVPPSTNGVRWGDKTPGYTTEVDRLHAVYPDAQFIHLIRDGRDVCLSLKKTGWHGEDTWTIAKYWSEAITSAHQAGTNLPSGRYLEIQYEDLVADPEAVLRSMCTFLDLSFEAGMLSFHQTASDNIPGRAEAHLTKTHRAPRQSDIQRWKTEQPLPQTLLFEAFAGEALTLAGYERRFKHGLAPIRLICRFVDWIAVASLPMRKKLGLHFPRLRKAL